MQTKITHDKGHVALLDFLQKFLAKPEYIFSLAIFVAVGASLCYLLFLYDIFRDAANVYAYCARELGRGNYAEGVSTRIPMLNVLIAGGLCAMGMKAFTACVLVSCCFYIATLFPLKAYLERYLTPLQAAWGCLLYATAPKIIRFSCTGIIDSGRVFFLIVALLYFFRSVEKPSWRNALFLGIGLGGLAVSRGEGLPAALCALFGVPVLALIRRKTLEPVSISRRIGHFAITFFSFLLATMPFCLINYHLAGYYVTDMRIIEAFNPDLNPVTTPAIPLTHLEHIVKVIQDFSRGAYELYLIFGTLGAILLLVKRKWKWDYTVLILLTLFYFAIYFHIISAYRYYIFMIPMFMMFTIYGLEPVVNFLNKCSKPIRLTAATVVVLLFAAQLTNGLEMAFSRKDRPFREVAAFIQKYAEHAGHTGKLRLAAPELPEIAFWSETFPVTGYNQPPVQDFTTFSDFDLMLMSPDHEKFHLVSERTDLEKLSNTPYPNEFVFFRKKEGFSQ